MEIRYGCTYLHSPTLFLRFSSEGRAGEVGSGGARAVSGTVHEWNERSRIKIKKTTRNYAFLKINRAKQIMNIRFSAVQIWINLDETILKHLAGQDKEILKT